MVYKGDIPPEIRAYVRFLRLHKQMRFREIAETCSISIRSAKRIVSKDLRDIRYGTPRVTSKSGRPRKGSERTERKILRSIPKLRLKEGTFSVKRLIQFAGVADMNVSVRTVQRLLNRNGYYFLQARKKGLMSAKDRRRRVQFARKMRKDYNLNIWKSGIGFYLDATSFVYKINPSDQARAPKTRVWRKKSEGLQPGCLAKGSKVGSGGKTVKLIVVITHQRGVVCYEPYSEMNGEFFGTFIKDEFDNIF